MDNDTAELIKKLVKDDDNTIGVYNPYNNNNNNENII